MSGEDDEGVGWYNVYIAFGDEEYVCRWYVSLLSSFFLRVCYFCGTFHNEAFVESSRVLLSCVLFYLFLRALLSDFYSIQVLTLILFFRPAKK